MKYLKYFESKENIKKYILIYVYQNDTRKNEIKSILLLKVKYVGKNNITTERLYDYGENGNFLSYYRPEYRTTIKISYDNLNHIIYQNDNLNDTINKMIEIYNITKKVQKYNI
jgi:hypothetical protein